MADQNNLDKGGIDRIPQLLSELSTLMRDGFQEMHRSTKVLCQRPSKPPNPARQVQWQDRELHDLWSQRIKESSSEEEDPEIFDPRLQTYKCRTLKPPLQTYHCRIRELLTNVH